MRAEQGSRMTASTANQSNANRPILRCVENEPGTL